MSAAPTTTPLSRSPRIHLAETWASFIKALAIYPDTNSRVALTLEEFFTSLSSAFALESDSSEIEIILQKDEVRVGDESAEILSKTNLAWLQERMDKAALAGAAFSPDLGRKALIGFARTLLGHYTRRDLDADFDKLWPADYPGLRLIDRRFEGAFTGTESDVEGVGHSDPRAAASSEEQVREQELIRRLSLEDSVHQRLLEIQDRLDEHTEGASGKRVMNLIGRIVHLMPAESMLDFDRVLEVTTNILETIANRSAMARGTKAVEDCQDDAALNKLMLIMSRRLFSRDAPETSTCPVELPPPTASARDERITEDFASFTAEFDALPEISKEELVQNMELPSEQLAVCLHYLVHHESNDKTKGLYPTASTILSAPGRDELVVFKSYIDTLRAEEPQGGRSRKVARIFDLLRETGTVRVLRRCGMLSEDTVIETFPRDFGIFVNAIDFARQNELDILLRICAAVGAERILAEQELLHREIQFADPDLAGRILGQREPALMPLARLILEKGGPVYTPGVVAYLRKLELKAPEACLLWIFEDLEYLPQDYLLAIMASVTGEAYGEELRERVTELLCRYVRDTGHTSAANARRIYAIKQLSQFRSEESEELLREILKSHKYVVIPTEPYAVRRAAKAALKHYS